jgi:hypothetical protein
VNLGGGLREEELSGHFTLVRGPALGRGTYSVPAWKHAAAGKGAGQGSTRARASGSLEKNQTVSSGVARDRDWRGRHKVQVSAESFEPNRDPLRARSGLGPPPSGGVSP